MVNWKQIVSKNYSLSTVLQSALHFLSTISFQCRIAPSVPQEWKKCCQWHAHYFMFTIPQCNASHFIDAKITVVQLYTCQWWLLSVRDFNLLLAAESTSECLFYRERRMSGWGSDLGHGHILQFNKTRWAALWGCARAQRCFELNANISMPTCSLVLWVSVLTFAN